MPKTTPKALRERQARVAAILPILKKAYPQAKCSLDHRTPLELLVATILSAQCTDDRVNIVTKDLFRKYRSAEEYSRVPQETLESVAVSITAHSDGYLTELALRMRLLETPVIGRLQNGALWLDVRVIDDADTLCATLGRL